MTPRRLRRPLRLAAAVAALALTGSGIAGCGQKGPLYLPGESPQQVEPGIPTNGAGPGRPEEEEKEEAAAER